jgi:RNA polymerase sigma-70 factor (ECF subfamily)
VNDARALVIKATDSAATLAERQEAFGRLVRMFQDMAYACAYAVLGDFCLAEDAAQEAFITAWRKLGQLRHPEAFAGWLRRIVLTECNRLTRGKRPRTVPLDDGDGACVAHGRADPQAALERDELTNSVFAAIKRLPEKERMAVVLFYVREHTQADIGAFLEVPLTTVAKRLHSARARLRGFLMDDFRDRLAARRPSRGRGFAAKVEAGIYDEYTGRYRFELRPELVVTIRREGDRLVSEAAGQTNELFAHDESEAELLAKEYDGAGRFVRDGRGRVSHFVYYEFGREMGLARKIC